MGLRTSIGIIIGMVLGFVLGLGAHFVFSTRPTTREHWRVVEKFDAYVTNAANFKPDPATGFSVTTPPAPPVVSLAALVAAGEVSHMDVVLPNVATGEATRHWMRFCQSHKQIVYMSGNPSYRAFTPAGVQPLHLNIWFRGADVQVVQTLLRELEQGYGK